MEPYVLDDKGVEVRDDQGRRIPRTLDSVVYQGYGLPKDENLFIVFRPTSGIASTQDIEGDFVQKEPLYEIMIYTKKAYLSIAWDLDQEIVNSMKYGYDDIDDIVKKRNWEGTILQEEGFSTYVGFNESDYHVTERTIRVSLI